MSVGEKRIRADDLIASLMDMMEPEAIAELVLSHEDAIEHGLKDFIKERDVESVNKILGHFFDRITEDPDPELFMAFFKTLTKRFDMSKEVPERVNTFFMSLLERIKELDDSTAFDELFLTLLRKVSITKANRLFVTKILEEALNRANEETDQKTAEAMFYALAKKANEKWVRQVLAPYIKKQRVVKSPILPKSCLMYQENLDGTEIAVIEVEKQRFDVTYHTTSFRNVGHPKLLFEFGLRLNKVAFCRVYAVKDAIVKPSSKLYRYPYSNVFEDFGACWPDLRNIAVQDLSRLSTLPYLFIKSPSNDHAYRGKNLRELFASLQNRDFDDDLLEDTGLTVAEHFEM